MAQGQFLVHGGNHAGNSCQVCSQGIEETFYDNGIAVFGLDIEGNIAWARGKRNVGVGLAVVFHETSIYRMDQSFGIACGNGNSGFVVGFQVVQIETDLVAFQSGKHAITKEGLRVATVVAQAVELGLNDVPAPGL